MLYAFAHPENAVSLYIIGKLGFEYFHLEAVYGWDVPMHVLKLH